MEDAITLENVTKKYKNQVVIDNICFDFKYGESVAFVGHNGCGKSTLLKLLAQLIRIDSGRVIYSKRTTFSYVPEVFPPMDISMLRYLKGIARMEGVEYCVLEQLIKDFFLEDMVGTNMKNMSKGSLQKVGVIQAILSPREVLLLDEPLSGQDVASQRVFVSKVKELRERGVTIFMSCHEEKLIKELSDKVYTIQQGKIKNVMDEGEAVFEIWVQSNHGVLPWKEMQYAGDRCMLKVGESELKETVLRLLNEGWELKKIEEDK